MTKKMITLTKEQREKITPELAIQLLKDGNQRFVTNLKYNRNLLQQLNETSEGQHPFAFILSCIDSRTSAELIFDQGLGDVFSCRIAGTVLNEDILGSMEFACKIAGVKLLMVLGHSSCGAIQGACDHLEMGHLSGLLQKIQPAIRAETATKSDRNSKNHEFVDRVAEINVEWVLRQIPKKSEIIREFLAAGKIALIGGMYDVSSGDVTFFDAPQEK